MITINNGKLTAEIDELGAQLSKLYTINFHYIWEGPAEIWPKHAPVLFPFVGRLPDGKYHFNGKQYSDVPIHGFAPYATFECIENKGYACTMKMIVSDTIKNSYPFDFAFYVRYELDGYSLKITYKAENKGSEVMYYAMGSHPGFNVPMKDNLKFEDYYLEFPDASNICRHLMNEKCFTTNNVVPYDCANGNRVNLKHNLFDNDAVILENTGYKVVIKSDKDSRCVTVDYPNTHWCAIWHKVKMEVPFVCIEPWFSLPGLDDNVNEISKRSDFFCLKKGQSNEHNLIITVQD